MGGPWNPQLNWARWEKERRTRGSPARVQIPRHRTGLLQVSQAWLRVSVHTDLLLIWSLTSDLLKTFHLFISRGKRRDIDWLLLVGTRTRDRSHNPGMCPDWELNQRPFGLRSNTQPIEPHQLGLSI